MWTGWVKNHLKCAGIGCGLPECFLSPLSINKPIYKLLLFPQCFSFSQENLGPFMIFSEISNPYNFSGRFCVRTKWMMAKRKADNHFICTIHVKKIYVMPVLTFRIEKKIKLKKNAATKKHACCTS